MTTAAAPFQFASRAVRAAPAVPRPQVASLQQLQRGQRARVLQVHQDGDLGERLMEMGLVAGTEVEVLRRGLWRGALQLSVRGYVLSLRHDDARAIEVAPFFAE